MNISVIGGSIAGLEAAIQLSQTHNVTVYEKHEIGHPLRCAQGWIVHHNIQPYGCITHKIDSIRLRLLENLKVVKQSTLKFRHKIYIIDRPRMEKKMAKLAEERGAKIIKKKAKLSELDGLIIDASGYPPQTVKEYKLKHRKGAVALQAYTRYETDTITLDIMKGFDGYFWIFPAKDGSNIGVGYWKQRIKLREMLDKYLKMLGVSKVKLTGGVLGAGLNRPFVRKIDGKTIAFVGDAAGLVDPFFAEGMTKAVLSARVLAKNIHSLDNYEREYMRIMRTHYIISNLLYWVRRLSPKLLFALTKFVG